ncbi:MAG: class II glutamine amidotransferase [Pseudomonadota bacterium]|nr:class II glutamine amidotransferase [Pseudomonadota bacterium]
MCELLAMSSSRPSHLRFSLQALTEHSRHGSRDGWGAAFYAGRDVALFREPGAASGSALVDFLQTRGPGTTLAISHIRHATMGDVALANTQPFVREMAGRMHAFAHNGNLPGILHHPGFGLGRYRPVGDTDSEHAFCVLLDRLHASWGAAEAPMLDVRLSVIAAFASELRELGPANFLYADCEVLFAHGDRRLQAADGRIRSPGLQMLERRCEDRNEALHGEGVSVTPGFQDLVLIASVPLSDGAWRAFAEGELVAVSMGTVLRSVMPPSGPADIDRQRERSCR